MIKRKKLICIIIALAAVGTISVGIRTFSSKDKK
ncbi:hypothetical protein CcarbDRAFT_3543 [Clostridium carboxidivorans P7]|uniref:Uncharacterized protein n=1 Tax=Clostridium carboxidivorans P7 TaxID=536227 RepID=C6PXM6_9CLOT|nr:hypothetical protein CcarbDRAFT_3543 [Clostridium carboxidivorans P7]